MRRNAYAPHRIDPGIGAARGPAPYRARIAAGPDTQHGRWHLRPAFLGWALGGLLVGMPLAAIVGSPSDPSCLEPPPVDCSTYRVPAPAFWREDAPSIDDEVAAAAIAGLQRCERLVGRPLRQVYTLLGRPGPGAAVDLLPSDSARVWLTGAPRTAALVLFDPADRRVTSVVISGRASEPGSGSGSSAELLEYCGQTWG